MWASEPRQLNTAAREQRLAPQRRDLAGVLQFAEVSLRLRVPALPLKRALVIGRLPQQPLPRRRLVVSQRLRLFVGRNLPPPLHEGLQHGGVVFGGWPVVRSGSWRPKRPRPPDRRQEPPCPPPGAAHREGDGGNRGSPAQGRHGVALPGIRGGHLGIENWRSRAWYPALEAAWDLEARPVPPTAHIRDRGARGWRLDVRVVAGDGHVDPDDRPALRAPREGLRGPDSGAARRRIDSIWRRTPTDRDTEQAAIPHGGKDRGRSGRWGSNPRPSAWEANTSTPTLRDDRRRTPASMRLSGDPRLRRPHGYVTRFRIVLATNWPRRGPAPRYAGVRIAAPIGLGGCE